MNDLLQFINDPTNDFAGHTIRYLQICALSIAVATLIGVTVGIAVSRNPILSFAAVNVSGLMRAIPVIAFLIAALPYLGVGFTPTVIALIVLGIPPILLNTYTGIRSIDPSIIDAARGMGMTRIQIVTRIQAPLVLAVIAAGIRTASVQIVGTATLAAIIGAGGYGEYITDGLNRLNYTSVLAGAIPVTLLAILIEILMSWLQFTLTPKGLRKTATSAA